MGLTSLDGITDGGMTQTRQQNAANETTGITGGGWNNPAYDAAGNTVSGPKAGRRRRGCTSSMAPGTGWCR
jgi:hypothetical protein